MQFRGPPALSATLRGGVLACTAVTHARAWCDSNSQKEASRAYVS